jgi:indole-3-glycerol phosphate synthase
MNTNSNEPIASTQGSASGYFWLTSKSGRPVYSRMAEKTEPADIEDASEETSNSDTEAVRSLRKDGAAPFGQAKQRAPRSPDGELIWKRREVHSGRAISVSTVEWSVAEKTAQPTSVLEGFLWEKEYEVDRHRERVPLVNLVSQCRQAAADPGSPKPRDWIKAIKQKAATGSFVIIPEFKRSDPAYEGGASLRRRYDFPILASDFVSAGATAVSVNCDAILFGGAVEHVSQIREALTQAALGSSTAQDGVVVPPILASDLILYPYQLYRLRLAGADAINLVAGALDGKDLVYLTKIAAGLQLQVLVTVTTQVQIQVLAESVAPKVGTILNGVVVSNRQLEDYSFDETGKQALSLLKSAAMEKLRRAVGDDFVVLVEGGVGIIEQADEITGESDISNYVRALAKAGAVGAIVGAGLAAADISVPEAMKRLQSAI